MEIQDILTLIQAVNEHKLAELKLDDGNIKLSLKKEEASQVVSMTRGDFQGVSAWSAVDVVTALAAGATAAGMSMIGVSGGAGAAETVAGGVSGERLNGAAGIDSDKVVNSSLVGTFYNAATSESESFVKVDDTMKKGQVMGIIETTKLMNKIECEFDGVAEAVLVDNEDIMEYSQPPFHIH